MNVRKAELKDYRRLMSLYQQLQPDDPAVADSIGRPVFESILASCANVLVVAEVGDSVVATCYLNIIPNLTRNARPYALIENVITDINHRRRGFGKAVIGFALDQAWKSGCYKVMLMTGRPEESTLNFYHACGLEAGIKTAFIAKRAPA